jgi:NTE family protein
MKKVVLFVFVFFAFLSSFSQEPVKPKLKVGLVLSGGGAKGFAHIGVLKVLEEAGVKISFIGGTSMGAVVGGLYASGYSANQIDSIFKATNFDELLKDFIPRSSKNFYEKRNDELYAISLPFHKFKIGIPTALSKGMYNYNLLTRLTHKVRHVRDFNKLPIPFLCMATDIETGEEVLLDKGYLPQAMLASSAFPTLFSPVEINGKLLVDGGVANNYPIDEVRKLGADIIIGVDVQDDLKNRAGLKDATRILVQISNLQMIGRMKQKIAETDIYIKPDINGFGVISFDDGQEIIRKGEEAAFSEYEKIQLVAEASNDYVKNNNRFLGDSIRLENIQINKLDNYTRSYVLGKLGLKLRKKINYNDIKIGIDNLSATQNFSAITYSLDPNNSNDDLNILLTENPIKTFLKFGLHYDGLYKSGILINLTQKNTFLKNDVALFDAVLGDNFRYNFDYYIDNGFHWSFGFKSRFNGFNKNVATDFSEGVILSRLGVNTINIDFLDFSNQAYLQTVFMHKFLIGAGLEHKHLKIKSVTLGNSTPTLEKSDYLSAFGYLKYDSFDNKYFPKKGWSFSGDFHSYLFSTDFTDEFKPFSIAKGDFGFAKTFYKKVTLIIQSEAGFIVGNKSVPFFDFVLGGYGFNMVNNFRHFYGYDFLSIAGDSYIKSSFTLDYEVFKKNHLNLSTNFANIQDGLFQTGDWFSRPKYNGYAVGYGLETIVGPLEIKYTWSPELSKGFIWFNMGFWF